ncbi:hypothetical protein BD414DRAFT_471645 [Trametes punicea]|nr:hypothetical protein BD414DRAFT_471645 [Trametes punicea]
MRILKHAMRSSCIAVTRSWEARAMSHFAGRPNVRSFSTVEAERPSFPPVYLDTHPIITVPLRTLDHRKLSSGDYVDLSDCRAVAVDPAATSYPDDPSATSHSMGTTAMDSDFEAEPTLMRPYINYGFRQKFNANYQVRVLQYLPFPTNTQGFFYFRRDALPIAGSVRFRVTWSDDLASFGRGVDLLTEHGVQWQIPLLAIAHSPRYELLRTTLERDGLVSRRVWGHCATLLEIMQTGRMNPGPMSQLIFETGESFYVDAARASQQIIVVGDETAVTLRTWDILRPVYRSASSKRGPWPYDRGRLICYLVKLPEQHGKTPSIGVRVLRVVEPLRVRADCTDDIQLVDDFKPRSWISVQGMPRKVLSRNAADKAAESVKRALLQRQLTFRRTAGF